MISESEEEETGMISETGGFFEMRRMMISALSAAALLAAELPFCIAAAEAQPAAKSEIPVKKKELPAVSTVKPSLDETIIREGIASVRRGVEFLLNKQLPDGSWGMAVGGRSFGHPAVTALVCMAINQSGIAVDEKIRKEAVARGRAYILKYVQPDGSIWMSDMKREYPTYTTAITLTCLASLGFKEDEPVMRAARRFLIDLQLDEDNKDNPTSKDDPSYGGVGYGPGEAGSKHVDLSNTQWVAEALYATDYLDREPNAKSPEDTRQADLAWDKLATFLTSMQHLPETNKAVWVVSDKESSDYGGFVYRVDEDGANQKTGQAQTLRSYGSMTYAGLKSMLYAKLSKDDPRVKAAVEWAAKHYTLDENPGIGQAGLYYYIQTFAKAHSVLQSDEVKTEKLGIRKWRVDLIEKMLELQKGQGEWFNDKTGRWMESSPELVTAYSLLAMELALGPWLMEE